MTSDSGHTIYEKKSTRTPFYVDHQAEKTKNIIAVVKTNSHFINILNQRMPCPTNENNRFKKICVRRGTVGDLRAGKLAVSDKNFFKDNFQFNVEAVSDGVVVQKQVLTNKSTLRFVSNPGVQFSVEPGSVEIGIRSIPFSLYTITRRTYSVPVQTVVPTDEIIDFQSAGPTPGPVSLTLPLISSIEGPSRFTFSDSAGLASTYNVTIFAHAGDTINQLGSAIISNAHGELSVISNEINMWLISNTPSSSSAVLPPPLVSIASLPTTADQMLYTVATNLYDTTTITAQGRSVVAAANPASLQAVAQTIVGVDVQPNSAGLSALGNLLDVAIPDTITYSTGPGSLTVTGFTSAARDLLDDSTTSDMRTTLGVVIGTDVQAYDTKLESLANLNLSSANQMIYTTAPNTFASSTISSAGRALVADATFSNMRSTLGLDIGSDVQAYNSTLQGIADTGASPNVMWSTDGTSVVQATAAQPFGLSLVAQSSASNAQTLLNVVPGSDVQAYSAALQSVANLTTSANQMIYTTAPDVYAVSDVSPFARTVMNDTSASEMRTTLAVQPGVNVQPQNSNLQNIADAVIGANEILVTDASGVMQTAPALPFGVSIVGTGSAPVAQDVLGLVPGTDVQAFDAALSSIAGLTTSADKMIYTTAPDVYAVTDMSSLARTLLADTTVADMQTTIAVQPGVDVQPQNATLQNIANTMLGANQMIVTDALGIATTVPALPFGVSIVGTASASVAQTVLGVVPGTDVQAFNPALSSIAGLVTAADKMIYTTAPDTYAVSDLSPLSRTLLADTTTAEMQSTLAVQPGIDVQAQNSNLQSIADTVFGPNQMLVNDALGVTQAVSALPFGVSVVGTASAPLAQAVLGLVPGTDVQVFDAALTSIAGLTTTANEMIYTIGSDEYATTDLTAFARTMLDDVDAATVRATLGLGSAALLAGPASAIVGVSDNQTLTNKTITDASNDVRANRLGDTSGTFSVEIVTGTGAPSADMVLVADGASTASWQMPLGNVTGMGLSSVNNLARYSDASGRIIKSGSPVLLDDAGNMSNLINVSATTLTGALTTAAQPNVTSVGTLSSLVMGGNISMPALATIDGVDVSSLAPITPALATELGNLTVSEIQQLQNIDSTTISIAQWANVGAMNQNVATTSTPSFAGLISSGVIDANGGLLVPTGQVLQVIDAPSAGADVTNKTYVDTVVASGAPPLQSCVATTTADIAAAFSSGAQTLTGVGTVLVIDGVALAALDTQRVLVRNQTVLLENGVYTRIADDVGNWVLQRTSDFNLAASPIAGGTTVFVTSGTTNAKTGWALSTVVTLVNTNDVVFFQQSASQLLSAGAGMTQIGNSFNVVAADATMQINASSIQVSPSYAGNVSLTTLGTVTTGTWSATTVAVSHGGTGSTTPAAARTALGLTLGVDVQAFDAGLLSVANLSAIAGDIILATGPDAYSTFATSAYGLARLTDVDANAAQTAMLVVPGTDVQVWDAGLDSIASLGTTADRILYTTGVDSYAETVATSFGRSLLASANAAALQVTAALQPGVNVQAYDAGLLSIANLTAAAGDIILATGPGAYTVTSTATFGISLLSTTSIANAQAALSLTPGTDVQVHSVALDSIAALSTAADTMIFTTSLNAYTTTPLTAFARSLLDDINASQMQATLLLVPGTNVQTWSAGLASLAALATAADRMVYTTAANTYAETITTAFGRSILNQASASTLRTALSLVPGTDVQAYDASLQSISGLTTVADEMIYTTAANTYATSTLTPFARTLMDDLSDSEMQTTLSLVPGTNIQPFSASLASLATLATAADRMMFTTAANTYAETITTSFGRSLLNQASASTTRSTLSLVPGTDVQVYNASLQSIAGLSTVADEMIYTTAPNTYASTALTTFARTLMDDTNAAQMQTTLSLVPGSDVQPWTASLTSLATLATAADRMMYTTAANTYAETTTTSFGRSLLNQASASTVRTTLSLVPGTDVQVYNASLQSIADLTTVTNDMIYATAPNTYAVTTLTPFARTLIDDASASAARTTLGLGTIATLPAPAGAVVGTTDTQTLTNKSLVDTSTVIINDPDPLKQFRFSAGSITSGATRIVTMPDANITVVGLDATQVLTNKTLTSNTNTIRATQLATTAGDIVTTAASPPLAGQVFTALSATTANWQTPLSPGSNFGRTVTVAKSGAQFTSIAAAVAAAVLLLPTSANPVEVLIYPGTYFDSNPITVPGFVKLVSQVPSRTIHQNVIAVPTTSLAAPVFILQANAAIHGIRAVGANLPGGVGFYTNSIGAGDSAFCGGCATQDCVIGFQSVGPSNIMQLEGCAVYLSLTAPVNFYEGYRAENGGTMSCVICGALSASPAGPYIDVGFHAIGPNSQIFGSVMQTQLCRVGLLAEAGSGLGTEASIRLASGEIIYSITDGVKVGSYGIVELYATSITSSFILDLNLTDSTARFLGAANKIRNDKIANSSAGNIIGLSLSETPGDVASIARGGFSVGAVNQPSDSNFGGGDSHVEGMYVYRFNGISAYTNITTSVSPGGAGTNAFAGLTTGNILYVGGSITQFNSVKVTFTTGVLPAGAVGFIAVELWNGASWQSVNVMSTNATAPYLPFANAIFNLGTFQYRFGPQLNWTQTTVGGALVNAYYMRFRITNALSGMPVLRSVKLGSNRVKFNGDGYTEYFGTAETRVRIPFDLNMVQPATNAPNNLNLLLQDDINIGRIQNSFSANAINTSGFMIDLPPEIDTSHPLRLQFRYMGTTNNTGNFVWVVRYGYNVNFATDPLTLSNVFSSTSTAPTTAPGFIGSISNTIPFAAASINKMLTFEVQLNVTTLVSGRINNTSGDLLWVTYERTGNSVLDTYTGSINLIQLTPTFTKWNEGQFSAR